jgi:Retrotransposon gag protein/Zinc knuckle
MSSPPSPTTPPTLTGRSLKMPTFSGGSDKDDLSPIDFVERIETYCKSTKRPEDDACVEIHLTLRGNALIWWRTLKRRGIDTTKWQEVRTAFLETYAPTITGQTAHAIGQMEQRVSETVNDYFGRLDQIIDEMFFSFPTVGAGQTKTYEDVRNHLQRYLFIGGLRENLRIEVLKTSPLALVDALKDASKAELIQKRQGNKIFAIGDDTEEQDHGYSDLEEDEIAAINQRRFRMGKKPLMKRRNNSDIKCYNCNRMGHISKNCQAPRRKPIRSIQEEQHHSEQPDASHDDDHQVNAIQPGNDLDFW